MITTLLLATAVAYAAAAASSPRIVIADDGRCKLEKKVSAVKTPVQAALHPAPVASAPRKVARKRHRAAEPVDEYVPCPPVNRPSLLALIPPPDAVVPEPFVAALPPSGLFVVPGVPAEPCQCFATAAEGNGGYGGGFSDGGGLGGGSGGFGGGGYSPPAIAPIPEPGTWAMLVAGLGFCAWRMRRA